LLGETSIFVSVNKKASTFPLNITFHIIIQKLTSKFYTQLRCTLGGLGFLLITFLHVYWWMSNWKMEFSRYFEAVATKLLVF